MKRNVIVMLTAVWMSLGLSAGAQVVKDGGFEKGTPNPEWDESSKNFPSPVCNLQRCGSFFGKPYKGDWWVWFGGAEEEEVASMRQEVTIPKGKATLTFWLDITASSGNGKDFMTVSIDEEELFGVLESDAQKYHPWTKVELDVSKFADDGEHLLSFDSTMTGPDRSNFFLDEVGITAEGGGSTCVYVVSGKQKGKKGCPKEVCPKKDSSIDSGVACGPPKCKKKLKIKKLDCPNGGDGYCKKVKLKKPKCE